MEFVSELKFRAVQTAPALSRDAEGGDARMWLMIVFSTGV